MRCRIRRVNTTTPTPARCRQYRGKGWRLPHLDLRARPNKGRAAPGIAALVQSAPTCIGAAQTHR
eukprot:scaffold3556_cov166-Isochrysis_galbana.AAC.3